MLDGHFVVWDVRRSTERVSRDFEGFVAALGEFVLRIDEADLANRFEATLLQNTGDGQIYQFPTVVTARQFANNLASIAIDELPVAVVVGSDKFTTSAFGVQSPFFWQIKSLTRTLPTDVTSVLDTTLVK